jgi:uncharacterized damage-inducible protein DinB
LGGERSLGRRAAAAPAASRHCNCSGHDCAPAEPQNGLDYTTPMAMKDSLLVEYDHEMGTTRKLLARLVDEKMSWKPHDRSMSLGGLATHLANLPNWGDFILNHAVFDLAAAPPRLEERRSRAEVLDMFDGTVTRTRASLDKTDAELVAPWTLKRGGQEVFTMPRASAFRTFVLYHTVHHRGQLSVYLRLNEIPVPAIYGPSADEG